MKNKKSETQDKKSHTRSVEILHHFSCGACKKWWSIGDAVKEKKDWFCPWCGEGNRYK